MICQDSEIPLQLDEIHYHASGPIIGGGHSAQRPCAPLTLESIQERRGPVHIYDADGVWDAPRKGAFNSVAPVVMVAPCFAPRVVWRKTTRDPMDRADIVRAVTLGDLGIGPAVYAVDQESILMERYTTDLDRLLATKDRLTARAEQELARSVAKLCRRMANLGLVAGDMKAKNIVCNLTPTLRVTDVRLIDFDSTWCNRDLNRIPRPARASKATLRSVMFVLMLSVLYAYAHTWLKAPSFTEELRGIAAAAWERTRAKPFARDFLDEMIEEHQPIFQAYGDMEAADLAAVEAPLIGAGGGRHAPA